jgi:hypothetical protein
MKCSSGFAGPGAGEYSTGPDRGYAHAPRPDGDTPDFSRYATWFIPLAVPLFMEADRLQARHAEPFVTDALASLARRNMSVRQEGDPDAIIRSSRGVSQVFQWQAARAWRADDPAARAPALGDPRRRGAIRGASSGATRQPDRSQIVVS